VFLFFTTKDIAIYKDTISLATFGIIKRYYFTLDKTCFGAFEVATAFVKYKIKRSDTGANLDIHLASFSLYGSIIPHL